MEAEKPTASSPSPPSRIADDLFGRKEAAGSSASSSSSSSGYFSSVFPPASSIMGKDSAHSDLYWTLDKQRTEVQKGNALSSRAVTSPDDKCQGGPSKSRTTSNKDGKSAYSIESAESSYFGSSIHYGGREFYSSSPSMRSSGAPNNYKNNNDDDLGDSNVATRGDWWQGSLYY
ncbi:hypothetical protein COCNU_04G001150 [Cocos nucifera]|uniref:Uncharacterized protein n=1 Tax=Cocos nucifera TaxID=13894 RepID=A0A8K0I531_COCNU|nr:hypothetical protein COCNU_04G001150 [Cocos nucifera]